MALTIVKWLLALVEMQRENTERIIDCSSGVALLGYREIPRLGPGVAITTFDAEGWQAEERVWTERGHHQIGETLVEFLGKLLDVPQWEAIQLEERIDGDWRVEGEAEWGRL